VPPIPDLPPIMVLPSTSGLACRAWDPAPWRAMAALVLSWRQGRAAIGGNQGGKPL
jgi:hypothetical protein